jgi:hypothetical protein
MPNDPMHAVSKRRMTKRMAGSGSIPFSVLYRHSAAKA